MGDARLGPYRLLDELGSGGMGRVYRAEVVGSAPGLDVGRVVAVKVIHPHLLGEAGSLERLRREAEIGKRVEHENVVRCFDGGAAPFMGRQESFLVMEYVEGQTLRGLSEELGVVPEALCRHVGKEVARGLAAIHAVGAVHRDLKPENVLITRDHEAVKVMDLGVARVADAAGNLSRTGVFLGTIRYAAPEQVRDPTGVDGRADLHALGVVLYELASGVHPYASEELAQVLDKLLHEEPQRLGEVNPQVSPFLEEVVHTLLAKDRTKRFGSAPEVARVLEEGEGSEWWAERLRGVRAATKRPPRRMRTPRETALYGRDADLERMRARYEQARAGDGQVLLLEGEAGIGKSRLVDEFLVRLEREGEDLAVLSGSYPPGGAATALGAFATAYRDHFGEQDLESAVRGRLGPAGALAPAWAAALRGMEPPPGATLLTRESLQTCFVQATRALAAERPTVVWIDDLHFAPEEGRSLFASLAFAAAGHRILLIGTLRPGVDETWLAEVARLPRTTRLALTRLGAGDLVRLLSDALRSERLASDLAGRIALKSDGNPFFVFEILEGLREGRFLARRPDGRWATTETLREIRIPSSVVDLVNARLSVLDEDDRALLDVAACCGYEFDPLVVGAALGIPRIPLLRRLTRIERHSRLVRSAGVRCVFDHHQIQEVLAGALPELLRREYHGAIADALESAAGAVGGAAGGLDGARCADLADHLLEAGQGTRALRYLDAALLHLDRIYRPESAVRLAERALAVPGLLAGVGRAKVLLRTAVRLNVLGQRGPQRAALEEALSLAREAGERQTEADVTGNLAVLEQMVGAVTEAQSAYERHLAFAREIGDRDGEAASTVNLGILLCSLGRCPEAREHLERGVDLARGCGNRVWEANARGSLGNVAMTLGRLPEAEDHLRQALAIHREVGDRAGEASVLVNLGLVAWALGDYPEAQRNHERALAFAQEAGDRRGEAVCRANLGSVAFRLGRLAEAQEAYECHLALCVEIGDRQGEVGGWLNLGLVLTLLGRMAEARESLERALAFVRGVGDQWTEGYGLAFLADAVDEAGDATAAERLLTASLDARRAVGARDGEAESLLARGLLRRRAGRDAEGCEDLRTALALARELGLPSVELPALVHLARLPGGDVSAVLADLAVWEARVSSRVVMDVRLALWRATGEREHLAEAKRRLDFLVEHALPEDRESMLKNVRLHREIMEAWAAAGREEEAGAKQGA